MKYKTVLFCFILFCIVLACQNEKKEKQDIIAVVNDKEITVEEFREFYELDPNFGLDSSGISALRDEIRFYICQKLALQKAGNDRLVDDPVFKRAIAWEERQAMLRQLFRDQVMAGVSVSEREVANLYMKQNTTVHVRHLFFSNEEAAAEAKKRLGSGVPFERIAREVFADSALGGNGGDLDWMRLGDLDDDFAEGIASLNAMQISSPVRSRWGYHIVQLLDRREEKILKEAEFLAQYKSLEKKIRRAKSQEESARYVRQFMTEKNPQPVERVFRLLWQAVVPYEAREQQQLHVRQMLSTGLLARARRTLANELDAALIVYQGGKVTLKHFLDAMEEIPEGQRPHFKSMRELSDQMAVWMRDEILYAEARAKGLEYNETVREEVRRFREEQSYYLYMNTIADSLYVPDSVAYYYQTRCGLSAATVRKWRAFHTLQEWKWNEARKRLWEQLFSAGPEFTIDDRLLHKENERINWDRRIPMFMLRKPQ